MTPTLAVLIDVSIKSSIILGVTLAGTFSLRRQSASLRHFIWTVGMLGALTLPLFALILPAWKPNRIQIVRYAEIVPPITQSAVSNQSSKPTPVASPVVSNRITAEQVALLVWILGSIASVLLLFLEVAKLLRIALHSSTVRKPLWRNLALEVSRALNLNRPVRLIQNTDASVLGTWGIFRPRVLLPREADSWSDERMRVVLGHELAHVKRNDWLVQVIAESARAIYWFNPLFWLACAQLRRESEHACDDSAMRLGVDGPTYAAHVLDLARTLKHSAQPATAALAMARASNLERRLVAMLNPSVNRRIISKGNVAAVVLLALGLTLPLAAIQPAETVIQMPASASTPMVASLAVAQPTAAVVTPRATPSAVIAPAAPPIQMLTGQISGTVSDPSGALVPGVEVIVTARNSGKSLRALSGGNGSFTVPNLSPGLYSMMVTLPGFQTSRIGAIAVDPGQEVQVKAALRVGVSVTVDIATESPRAECLRRVGGIKPDGTPFTSADCPNPVISPERNAPRRAPASPPDDIVILSTSPIALVNVATPTSRYPLRIGGDIQQGNLIYSPKPAYPSDARRNEIDGYVVLSATINEDGSVQSVKVIDSTNSVFEDPTAEIVRTWRFKPTLLNMQPITTAATITANFLLGN